MPEIDHLRIRHGLLGEHRDPERAFIYAFAAVPIVRQLAVEEPLPGGRVLGTPNHIGGLCANNSQEVFLSLDVVMQ